MKTENIKKGRLLNAVEIETVWKQLNKKPLSNGLFRFAAEIANAQLAKDQEHEQARVERIFQEIDSLIGEFSDSEDYDMVSEYWQNRLYKSQQALKEKEGIK